MRKLEFDYVKTKLNDVGFELLSTEYFNNETPLKCKCNSCGLVKVITFTSIQKGSRCKECWLRSIRKDAKINCVVCGEERKVAFSRLQESKYCSRKCQFIGMTKVKDGKRQCSKCHIIKSCDEFRKRKNKSDDSWCNTCRNEYASLNRRRPTARFKRAITETRRRGLVWDIELETYLELIKEQCVYCGSSTGEVGIGLDRVDSSKSYLIDNVTPCCGECNRIKSDKYSHDEMLLIGNLIKSFKVKK